MTGDRRDEFYVGYLDETPPGIGRFVRRAAIGLAVLAAALGAGLALLLERFDEGVFEYGTVRDYNGELLVDPHPRLLTVDGPAEGYLLVGVGKHGLDVNEEPTAPWSPSHSREIQLAGTLIQNPEAAMLEVHSLDPAWERGHPARIREAGSAPNEAESANLLAATGPAPAGGTSVLHVSVRTFVGEIVDTKCYLGAMKPGRGKPHRDCASLCIRGGIPAALLVRTEDGERALLHLVNLAGQPLGPELLDWVGKPVAVMGQLRRHGDRLILNTFLPPGVGASKAVRPHRSGSSQAGADR